MNNLSLSNVKNNSLDFDKVFSKISHNKGESCKRHFKIVQCNSKDSNRKKHMSTLPVLTHLEDRWFSNNFEPLVLISEVGAAMIAPDGDSNITVISFYIVRPPEFTNPSN